MIVAEKRFLAKDLVIFLLKKKTKKQKWVIVKADVNGVKNLLEVKVQFNKY